MEVQVERVVKTPRRTSEQLKYHRERQRLYVAKNRDVVNRRQREFNSRPDVQARRKEYDKGRSLHRLLGEAKKRAKAKGILITITVADIKIPELCPVLGIPISAGGQRDHWPSLDRRDNSIGYIPGNVFVISNRANRIKNDATLAEVEAIVRYMRGSL